MNCALPTDPADSELEALLDIARQAGLPELLSQLNARVPHRYTAIYRLSGETLHCQHLIDKTGAVQTDFLAKVPLRDSFCQFVFRDGIFLTENSAFDHRLDGHPYQGIVVSYHAIPLMTHDGLLYGTLCHLDTVPCALSDEELDLLKDVAGALPNFLEPSTA